ncbi:hypothetical protein N7533_013668 [Penicillium manginii]|uniref:uncharacterized protein n=1 Tax=Penicillium manginii TaxID=203109 RepID=UPI002546791F|nr:uncharacterized protein N7533_013668 [Penicillium manginii]KAJ5733221.1 hypothetical protein N7533_013668 [Penicillium manginii]
MPSPYQYLKVPVKLGDMDVLVAAIGRRTTFSFQLELLLNSRLQQVGIITRRELVPTPTSIVRGMEQTVTLLTVVTELRVWDSTKLFLSEKRNKYSRPLQKFRCLSLQALGPLTNLKSSAVSTLMNFLTSPSLNQTRARPHLAEVSLLSTPTESCIS